ncbi:5-hydroxytryptamine receptor 1A-alpha-like [Diadema antillarum]|uniref:5-hydroxytryptamine receptor 1A-alpha-like n=1 Tax=Diadema antillarum TaxID=105358 RepID=UPI003A8624DC
MATISETNLTTLLVTEIVEEFVTVGEPVRDDLRENTNIEGMILASIYCFVIIFVNSLCLAAFAARERLRTYNNYYIINMVVSDVLVGILLVVTIIHTYKREFPFSTAACRAYLGVREVAFTVSVITVVVICIDRHQATYHPIEHYTSRSRSKALMANGLTWLLCGGFWLSYCTGWDFAVDVDNTSQCIAGYARQTVPAIVSICLSFFLPLVIVAVLYLRIYIKIRQVIGGRFVRKMFSKDVSTDGQRFTAEDGAATVKPESARSFAIDDAGFDDDDNDVNGENAQRKISEMVTFKTQESGSNVESTETPKEVVLDTPKEKHSVKNRESTSEATRATRTLTLIFVSMVIAWLPQSIVVVCYSVRPTLILPPNLPGPLLQTFVWLRYTNSILNPFCYVITQPLFRQTLLDILLCRLDSSSSKR